MYRKWKSVTALSMAALIGCLIPMGTMMAAEENPEVVQEVAADSEADVVDNDEITSDDSENAVEEGNATTDENVDDEINIDDENIGDEINADDANASVEVDAGDVITDDEVRTDNDGNAGIEVMSETEVASEDVEAQASSEAPVIDIKLNGESCKYDLGGSIEYKYVNDPEPKLEWSANHMFYYYLDRNPGDTAMGIEDITWSDECLSSVVQILSDNQTYVVYVKAEADGQTVYARSCGIVVDTEAPKLTGVTDGGTCPEGTIFHVEDANLESVTVNGKLVTLASDGNYQVTAAGTSCEIKAKDKAGNETTYSITVTARDLEANGAISVSGTYSLKEATSYQLSEGKWQVDGDSTVYSGGNTFYVGTDGNYRFTKR